MGDCGRLIVFEGPEGAGKTTQLERLAGWLVVRGVPCATVREPGTSPVGQEIRRLVLDPSYEVTARAEALLFLAARAELVERELRPRLARGETVLADRFFLSTYAYQVHGRGLPEREVVAANGFATGGLVPDLTILLQLSPAVGLERARSRGAHDRMELEGADFHQRVAAAFRSFAQPDWRESHPECGRVASVAGDRSEDEVFDDVLAALTSRWPELGLPAGGTRER